MNKETLEEAAVRYTCGWGENDDEKAFIAGAKWQAERMYSEEEVINLLNKREDYLGTEPSIFDYSTNEQWFEQFKKK